MHVTFIFFTIFIIECVSFFIISLQMHETFEIRLRKCQEKNWFEKTACDKRLIYADTRRHAQYFPFSRAHTRTFIASIVVISSPPHFECTTRTKKAHCFHCQPHTSVPISWFVCCFFFYRILTLIECSCDPVAVPFRSVPFRWCMKSCHIIACFYRANHFLSEHQSINQCACLSAQAHMRYRSFSRSLCCKRFEFNSKNQ